MGKRLIRREAYASRAASSPHLPALLHACCNGSEPFLVFPYLAGGSLEERLSRYGAPPPILAFWLVRQTLAALRALHDAGWAHGDIKPANILIGQDLHTTLIDLGFAQRLQTDGDRAELKMFTPGYAAPEIHREATATRESDLYSLGVTLFEALCGRRPFYGTTPAELAEAHWMETPPDIRKLNANVPFETAKLLRRMLAKDPSERPSLDAAEEDILRLEIECFDRRAA